MRRFDVSEEQYKKSTFSPLEKPVRKCVEVARTTEGVAVRSSTDLSRTTVYFTTDEWRAFVSGVHNGEFEV